MDIGIPIIAIRIVINPIRRQSTAQHPTCRISIAISITIQKEQRTRRDIHTVITIIYQLVTIIVHGITEFHRIRKHIPISIIAIRIPFGIPRGKHTFLNGGASNPIAIPINIPIKGLQTDIRPYNHIHIINLLVAIIVHGITDFNGIRMNLIILIITIPFVVCKALGQGASNHAFLVLIPKAIGIPINIECHTRSYIHRIIF
jgi:hypothetical protein